MTQYPLLVFQVVSFLRPLVSIEKNRRRQKLAAKKSKEIERKVEKVQAINGLSQLKQLEHAEQVIYLQVWPATALVTKSQRQRILVSWYLFESLSNTSL